MNLRAVPLGALLLACGACGASKPPPAVAPPITEADVLVERRAIYGMAHETIVPLPDDRSEGVAAAYRREGGPHDPFIVPLGRYLQIRSRREVRTLRVDVDPSTPYRVFVEVLFTSHRSGFPSVEVRLADASKRHTVFPEPSRFPDDLGLIAIVTKGGVALKTHAGNVAPGCATLGDDFAVPRTVGTIDREALRACAKKLKAGTASAHRVTIVAGADETFAEVLDVVDDLRGAHAELFPDVGFGWAGALGAGAPEGVTPR